MQPEIEVKILNVNVNALQRSLKKIGAIFDGKKQYKRHVYQIKNDTWIRLRTDGTITTVAVKQFEHDGIDGTKEAEVQVDDFKTMHSILQQLNAKSMYQENRRLRYRLNDVTIDIDFWPRIPAYVEIEGPSQKQVEFVVSLLGFTMAQTTSVNTTRVYAQHGMDIHSFAQLVFPISVKASLMMMSKITAVADELGISINSIQTIEEIDGKLLLQLTEDTLPWVQAGVICFGDHIQSALLQNARDKGGVVYIISEFVQKLPEILQREQ